MRRQLNFLISLMLAYALPMYLYATPAYSKLNFVTVTFVKGQAFTGKKIPIKAGTRLYQTDTVVFKSAADFLVAISPDIGRVKISLRRERESSGELLALVLDMAKLSVDTRGLLDRGDDDVPLKYRLENALSTDRGINPKLLITGVARFLFDTRSYPMDADRFFVLQFQSADGKWSNKKLSTLKDTLFLSPADFRLDGGMEREAESSWVIGYYDKEKNEIKPVGDGDGLKIDPYLDETGQAHSMIETIYRTYNGTMGKRTIFKEINSELYYYMGKPNKIWLQQQWNLLERK